MWKKQDETGIAMPEPGVAQTETSPDPFSEAWVETRPLVQSEKVKPAAGPQRVVPEAAYRPAMPASITAYPANMAAYAEAVNEFTKNATALIEQLPLLNSARSSYDKAMKASGELRKVLDIGDEDLRLLMTQLQQVFDWQGDKAYDDRKKPEVAKMGAKGAEDNNEGMLRLKRLP